MHPDTLGNYSDMIDQTEGNLMSIRRRPSRCRPAPLSSARVGLSTRPLSSRTLARLMLISCAQAREHGRGTDAVHNFTMWDNLTARRIRFAYKCTLERIKMVRGEAIADAAEDRQLEDFGLTGPFLSGNAYASIRKDPLRHFERRSWT
jgi:hypothetical protein